MSQQLTGIETFTKDDDYFIKFFLLDASVNLNAWGVTNDALKNNLQSFIGKPFVVTDTFGHPKSRSGDTLMNDQEKFRKGSIIEVGIDQKSGKAYGIAHIKDQKAIELLKSGEVSFVSPAIVFNETDIVKQNGKDIIVNFEGAHVAGVKDPAYGMVKAQIKGKCSGTFSQCQRNLSMVEASIKDKITDEILAKKTREVLEEVYAKEYQSLEARVNKSIQVLGENIDAESFEKKLEAFKTAATQKRCTHCGRFVNHDILAMAKHLVDNHKQPADTTEMVLASFTDPCNCNKALDKVAKDQGCGKDMVWDEDENKCVPKNDSDSEGPDPQNSQASTAKAYPWDECIADQKAKGSDDKEAAEICGEIKAKSGKITSDKATLDKNRVITMSEQQQMTDNTKVQEQISTLTAKLDLVSKENESLKQSLVAEQKKPIVSKIVDAKVSLGKIKVEDRQAEFDKLLSKEADYLVELSAQYDEFVAMKKEAEDKKATLPFNARYTYQASKEKLGDSILVGLTRS